MKTKVQRSNIGAVVPAPVRQKTIARGARIPKIAAFVLSVVASWPGRESANPVIDL